MPDVAASARQLAADARCTARLRQAIAAVAAGAVRRPMLPEIPSRPWWKYPNRVSGEASDCRPHAGVGTQMEADALADIAAWAAALEEEWGVVRDEFFSEAFGTGNEEESDVRGTNRFDSETNTEKTRFSRIASSVAPGGDWRAIHLINQGRWDASGVSRFPRTTAILRRLIGGQRLCTDCGLGYAYFSVIQPGTHILPHCGPSNVRLRCQLALGGEQNCEITVGGETHTWERGKLLVFDDSFVHSVRHNGGSDSDGAGGSSAASAAAMPRVVLLFDVWHPSLTAFERHAMRVLLPAIDVESMGNGSSGSGDGKDVPRSDASKASCASAFDVSGCKLRNRLTRLGNSASTFASAPSTEAIRGSAAPESPSAGTFLVLDGGLGTELERAHRQDIKDALWSGKALLECPDVVGAVHRSFAEAGADIVCTATYQLTHEGLHKHRDFSAAQTDDALRAGVELVRREVAGFIQHPLVAASLGPYGGAMTSGGEFRALEPDITVDRLVEFHRRRVQVVKNAAPDILAFETVPDIREVVAYLQILECLMGGTDNSDDGASRHTCAWISLSCQSETELCDGTPVEDAIRIIAGSPAICAVGFNCCSPQHVPTLVERARTTLDDSSPPRKLLVAYPNSGEAWDDINMSWIPNDKIASGSDEESGSSLSSFGDASWIKHVQVVGGCCRTTPDLTRTLVERRRHTTQDLR